MKRIIMILLTALMTVSVACSKKKSGGTVATPPPVVDDDNNNNNNNGSGIDGLPAPVNTTFYYGFTNISQRTTYKNFLKAAFGYQLENNGGSYGNDSYNYNYNYSCNLDILRWLTGDRLVNCGSGSNDPFEQYIDQLSQKPAIVQLLFRANGTVSGLWLVDGIAQRNYQDPNCSAFSYQNNANCTLFYAQQQIPFEARVTRTPDGRYLLEAGPLVFLTTTSVSNFDIFFEEGRFANVRIQ